MADWREGLHNILGPLEFFDYGIEVELEDPVGRILGVAGGGQDYHGVV
jgi:hypothetical protein